jgi:hypothetical protein
MGRTVNPGNPNIETDKELAGVSRPDLSHDRTPETRLRIPDRQTESSEGDTYIILHFFSTSIATESTPQGATILSSAMSLIDLSSSYRGF